MGKNKNRNKKNKKNQPSNAEHKSLISDGIPCITLPERENMGCGKNKKTGFVNGSLNELNKSGSQTTVPHTLSVKGNLKLKIDEIAVNETKSSFNEIYTPDISRKNNTFPVKEDRSSYRENIQNEWDDFFNESSKTNAFKKSDFSTLGPGLKNKRKSKLNQTAVNETKDSLNKMCTQSASNSSRKYANNSTRNTETNEFPLAANSHCLLPTTPVLINLQSKEETQAVINSKIYTPKQSNEVLNNDYLYKGKAEEMELNLKSSKKSLQRKQRTSDVKNNFSCKNAPGISNNTDMNETSFDKGFEVSSNVICLGFVDAPISNGTISKSSKSIYPLKNSFRTQTSKESTESLYKSINICEIKYNNFRQTYFTWKKKRQETIRDLKKLKKDVHDDQLMFNKTNVLFKELNITSRQAKQCTKSTAIDILTSLTTLATDAASGITSFAQAFNIDGYMATFAKIMEHDQEITKPLYAVRSLCLKQYQDVEEVLRKYHSDTFGGTVANVSNALSLEELWMDLKGSQGKDVTSTIMDSFDKFFTVNLNNKAMTRAFNSIQDYTEKNPATVDACLSAGKICCDIYDAWSVKPKMISPGTGITQIANNILLQNERDELMKLRSVVDDKYEMQARLESDISDAIDDLQAEMEEIDNNFEEISFSFNKKF